MHLHLVRGLRAKHPNSEIHILINQDFIGLSFLIRPEVDRIIYFPRAEIQKFLVEPEFHVTKGFAALEQFISQDLNSHYDLAYNFTHNRLSGYLLSLLSVREVRGVCASGDRFVGVEQSCLLDFEERFSSTHSSALHYIEWLSLAFDIEVSKPTRRETHGKRILFQVETSDPKKNVKHQTFRGAIAALESLGYRCQILASQSDSERLARLYGASQILVANLEGVAQELLNCSLLVSVDTGIKHLAAYLGIPVVEICVGSSDAVKTSAFWNSGSQIVGESQCYPCRHSNVCNQTSHLCEGTVNSISIIKEVRSVIEGNSEPMLQWSSTMTAAKEVWRNYINAKNGNARSRIAHPPLSFSRNGTAKLFNKNYWEMFHQVSELLFASDELTSECARDLLRLLQELRKGKGDPARIFGRLVDCSRNNFPDLNQLLLAMRAALAEAKILLEIAETMKIELPFLNKLENSYSVDEVKALMNLNKHENPNPSRFEGGSRNDEELF